MEVRYVNLMRKPLLLHISNSESSNKRPHKLYDMMYGNIPLRIPLRCNGEVAMLVVGILKEALWSISISD